MIRKHRIPLISVVMTVYNTDSYLPSSIESILGQTLEDFEFIIVDDGSTDNSLSVLQHYASIDDRIIVIHQKNQGISRAANAGIEIARGTYIARMDSDDISRSDRLDKQCEYLVHSPECVAVGSWFNTIDASGATIPATKFGVHGSSIVETPTTPSVIDSTLLSGGLAIAHPSSLIQTRAIRSVSGYQVKYVTSEDRDLFLRLSEIGPIHNLQDVLLSYRIREDQISSIENARQLFYSMLARRDAYLRRNTQLPDELSLYRFIRLRIRMILTKFGLHGLYTSIRNIFLYSF